MRIPRLLSILFMILLIDGLFLPSCVAVDTDGDYMPDDWETTYHLNPEDPNDASADLDDDGLSNIREFFNTTDPTNPFLGGKIKAAYTYQSQMTEEKIDELLEHEINTILVKGCLNTNVNYSSFPDQIPDAIRQDSLFAQEKKYMFFVGLDFVHRHFFPNDSIVEGGYPVVYSDGVIGKQMSPFCEAYWQHLTNITVSLASLSINYPDRYRLDGVMFDFELYGQPFDSRPSYFDTTWGFENETFTAYLENRQIPYPTPKPENIYNWLIQQDLQDDYYLFLSETIRTYATNMRIQVKAVNPYFLLGAYPSPTFYLSEIYSGWSNRDEPIVIWATEMYNNGGADQIPNGLENHLLPEGYYNLTEIYPSEICGVMYEIYSYYVSGVINYRYISGNWAYHLYHLLSKTNGYWIYTTYSFTESFETLNPDYRVMNYDEVNNTLSMCENGEQYAEEVCDYYDQMDVAHTELQRYLNDSSYQSSITLLSPPPILLVTPSVSYLDVSFVPLDDNNDGQLFDLAQTRFRSQHNFVMYTQENQPITVFLSSINYHTSDLQHGLTYVVLNPAFDEILRGILTDDNDTMISFIPQITGNYYLLIEPIQGSFEISKTNVPLSLYKNKNDPIHIISTPCSIYFWIGDVDSFCINISGQGTFEGAQTTIFHSSVTGYEMVISGGTTQYHNALTFNVNVPSDARNRIWKIDISQPSAPQWLEDVYITFNQDVDPYFGLTDNSLYFMKQKIVSIPNDNGGSSSGVDTSFNPGENEAEDNTLPSTPRQPSGPTFVERGVEYLYTSSTSSVNGVKIRYRFEWGDDAISNWSVFVSSNTSISMSHSWEIISSFEMRVIAQDENGFNSSWSIPLIVTVSQINLSEEPPIVDFILPSNVSTNKIIQFDTVGSFDSDGAIITYFWDFGDGEIGTGKKPYHIYKNPGQYTVTLTITNNMGNIYSKSSIITVAASDEGIAQDQQNFALPYLHFIIMGTIIIVLTCLILFFRSRIKRFFLEKGISHGVRKIERLDAEITELKHAIQKNH